MSENRDRGTSVLGKNEALQAGKDLTGRVVGERTEIDVSAFSREYKLGNAYASIRNLEVQSDKEIEVQTFARYLVARSPRARAPFSAERKRRPRYPADEAYRNRKLWYLYPNGDLLILVDGAVYDAVAEKLDRYVLDVGRDGYWANVHVLNGGTPAQVREYIKRRRRVGVLLVGAIAAPWYEHDGSQFPCDLYYMDTNGTWDDPDGDGKFNDHAGDLNPEIWVGRLWTPTAGGNDATLINDYLDRNHKFRLGKLGHARSALAFVDDDWTGFEDCAFDEMFPASVITTYTTPTETDADLYKAEVNRMRSWVQLCAHSWTQGHSLQVGDTKEYIQVPYFRDTNPPNAHFYNLFCCMPGKYTAADYLAGWYIFDKSGGGTNLGLTAVASAKSGSMLFFEDFYEPMGRGRMIGDAYVAWWQARGPDHEDWERSWFYGLVLLGDPTLNWWKGAVPCPQQPQAGDVFDHWPRNTQFMWSPVNLPGTRYDVEVDAFGAVHAGQWAEESNRSFRMYHNIAGNTLDHVFVGAQRGRWRVRARVGSRTCSWSPWSYFEFTI